MSSDVLRTDLSTVAQIKLYFDLFVPPDLDRPAPLLIAVHGYGAHKRYMMREARRIAPPGMAIAAIQSPHPHYRKTTDGYRVGYGWLSDHRPEEYISLHHRFILDVIEKLSSEGIADSGKVWLYGFSQACALNFRFALTHYEAVVGVIGVSGGIPGDLDSNPNYKPTAAQTFYLFGDDDEFYTQKQFADFNRKLGSILPNYRSKHYRAKHEITDDMRADMALWLKQAI